MSERVTVAGDAAARYLYPFFALLSLTAGCIFLATRQWINGALELAFAFAWASFEAVRRRWVETGYQRGRLEVLDHLQRALPDMLEDVLEHQLQLLGAEIEEAHHRGGDDAPP